MENTSTTIPTDREDPLNQMPPPPAVKNSHIVAITIVMLGSLFVVLASIWIFNDTASKTKRALVITPPVVTPTAVPISPTSPPPTHEALVRLSEELRSGDQRRVASVMHIDPTKLSQSTVVGLAQLKDILFDEKSFRKEPNDEKHARIKVTFVYKDSMPSNQGTFFLVLKNNSRWIIEPGKK